MSNNLHSLFSGAFYINEMYGISCLPTLYRSIVNNTVEEKSRETLIEEITNQSTSQNPSTKGRVVVINFKQPVVKYDYGSWLGTQTYIAILESFKNDSTVTGVVLDSDTGGGQVYGTGEFYDYILNYPKPIVTYTNGYLCSGGYYFAAATKYIVANKRADAIGSIGAYSTIIDSNGIWEHFGAKVHVMYASKSKGKNSEYREVIENSNYEPYIKNQLDPIVETFHKDMKAARPQLSEEVFDGSTWTGANSLSLGLIDEIGTLQTAIDKVFELSKATNNSNNNSNNQNMARLNVPNLEDIIGESFSEGENETGVLLTDEQVQAIEQHLQENATALNDAETTATALQTATEEATNVTNAVQTALAEAEVDNATEMSNVQGVEALAALVAEYGSNDGGSTTKTIATTEGEGENVNIVGGIDISAALNN
ncbi:S49 family peptidase [Tenacibaculum singaporense]|uniref:S49 family peptidase n=1 Tax=Tenacibaculum singaporense TaxID=2358479 RepID=UPI00142DDF77|nr:S49 family peptidase [Tenacibaculum singaporense]